MSSRSSPAFGRAAPRFAPMHECGRCRVCGCVDDRACIIGGGLGARACGWADAAHTLCDNPVCLASAGAAAAEAEL